MGEGRPMQPSRVREFPTPSQEESVPSSVGLIPSTRGEYIYWAQGKSWIKGWMESRSSLFRHFTHKILVCPCTRL